MIWATHYAVSILLLLSDFTYILPTEAAICQPVTGGRTADRDDLKTWWHDKFRASIKGPVAPDTVRQSHFYSVKVASSNERKDKKQEDKNYYDSFVYSAIPRNGNGNILRPGDPSSVTDQPDGITLEANLSMSMSWTQFLYSDDVKLKISRKYLCGVTAKDITIRPNNLNYKVSDSHGDIYIDVPYSDRGTRFSVEFADNYYNFRTHCENPSYCYFVDTFSEDDQIVGREPLNSLLIFASPMPVPDENPDPNAASTLSPEPGLVTNLDKTNAKTIYFKPGVYYLTGTAHANLSSTVNWFHISGGAYVKGAVQFNTDSPSIKLTGYGVLSGEQYVYQANPSRSYTNYKQDSESLKMIEGYSHPTTPQTLHLSGITLSSPPFNTFDFTGDLDTISVQAHDYKQVGSFFGQTDGLTVYPNSHLRDIFYHSNDDTIKPYYSNSLIERITVWKGTTAPIIQFGWSSRTLTNITVDTINVIHTRWNSNASHPTLIGSNQIYGLDDSDRTTANTDNTISDLTFTNIHTESINGGSLFRIIPLSTIKSLTISNVYIQAYPPAETGMRDSQLPGWYDSNNQMVGVSNFLIKNFTVGNNDTTGGGGSADLPPPPQQNLKQNLASSTASSSVLAETSQEDATKPKVVTFKKDNWEVGQLGSMNIAPEYLNSDDGVRIIST